MAALPKEAFAALGAATSSSSSVACPVDAGGSEAEQQLVLSVRLASGAEVAVIPARSGETVRALKKKIMEADGTPTSEQRLLFGMAILSNSQTLSQAGLRSRDVITLIRLGAAETLGLPVRGTVVGDGIMVLEELADAKFEPTEDDVDEYAEWLGLDPDGDGDLLWIAREGLTAPLLAPWRACETPDRELFYFNFETGQSTWDHPVDDAQREKVREHKERRLALKIRPPEGPRPSLLAPRRWLLERLQDHRTSSPRPAAASSSDPPARGPPSASSSSSATPADGRCSHESRYSAEGRCSGESRYTGERRGISSASDAAGDSSWRPGRLSVASPRRSWGEESRTPQDRLSFAAAACSEGGAHVDLDRLRERTRDPLARSLRLP